MTQNNVVDSSAQENKPGKKGGSDLLVRIGSGAIFVTLCIVMALLSEATTVLLLCVLAGMSASELFIMLRSDAKLPNELLGVVAAVAYPASVWLFGLSGAWVVTGALLVGLLVWYVFFMRARVSDVGVSFFGAAYTGLLLSGLVVVRMSIPGVWGGILVAFVFASVWMNDSFAYLVGRAIGKHKMAPRISPKKSWEGLMGGLAGCVLTWCLMTFIPGVEMSFLHAVPFGIVCGLAGVLGDLAESRMKRNSGVKDSGNIMPGHGGILDRCDSMFLVSVVSAVLLVYFGCVPIPF